MVFQNGDNNLEGDLIDDFLEMAAVGSNTNVTIVAQLDRIPGYVASYGDWTDARRGIVNHLDEPWDESNPAKTWGESLGEVDMGNPQTLVDFLEWAKSSYPARKYALIIEDHGNGWKPRGAEEDPIRAVSFDDTNHSSLNLSELKQALITITNNSANKLDIIGFDACLMAMIEVDHQIKPYADYRIASEEVENLAGWDYTSSLELSLIHI